MTLGSGWPGRGEIHSPVDNVELSRVEPKDSWCKFLKAATDSSGIGRKVCGTPRTAFTPTGYAFIGVEANKGGVEPVKVQAPAGQRVLAF